MLTSSTMPSVIIEIGSRATSAVAEKARAPGRREDPAIGGEHQATSPRARPRLSRMPDPQPYDALLLVSFGGPEKPDDVVPVPAQRDGRAGHPRRAARGGRPALLRVRRPQPDQRPEPRPDRRDQGRPWANGIDLPVYWGNRNWDPFLREALEQMRDDGVTRAAALLTSAYSSYSGCRQYRENLADAVAEVPGAPRIDRLRQYFNHPGFIEPMVDATLAALAELPEDARHGGHLAFVTHSIPIAMNDSQRSARVVRTSPSTGSWPPRSSSGCARRPGTATPRPSSTARGRARRRCPGWSPTSTTTCARLQDKARARRGGGPDRLRLRPHGGHLRPRHRGEGDRRGARAAVRARGHRRRRPALRGDGARPARRARRRRSGASRPSARRSARTPAWDVCPAGCCPNPRGRGPPCAARTESRDGPDRRGRRPARPRASRPLARPDGSCVDARGGVDVADTKSSPIDVVTEADRACEELILERLLGARPDDGFVGEEGDDVARAPPGSAGSSTRSTGP